MTNEKEKVSFFVLAYQNTVIYNQENVFKIMINDIPHIFYMIISSLIIVEMLILYLPYELFGLFNQPVKLILIEMRYQTSSESNKSCNTFKKKNKLFSLQES